MNQIVQIQALRAFAALAVAYGHAAFDAGQIAARAGRPFDAPYRELSAAGVDLFFVISGFVMVWSSRALFATPGAARVFALRRLARIAPLYWATTTLFLIAMAILPGALNSAPPGLSEIAKSYLFVPFRRADDGLLQPIYRLGWTLNYEMFFYACFAALLWLKPERAVAALTAGFAALAAAGLALKPDSAPAAFWTNPIILEFVLGALIGLAYLKGARLGPAPAGAAILLAAALFVLANPGGLPDGLERLLRLGVPAALAFAGCVLIRPGGRDMPGARGLAALGDASYALYLIHPMAIRGLNVAWTRAGLGDIGGGWAFILAGLALSAATAILVYRAFERPLTRRLQRRR